MQRTLIYGDKLVNAVDMNGLQTDIADNIIAYTPLNLTWSRGVWDPSLYPTLYSVYQGGVLGDPRNSALTQDLSVVYNDPTSVILYPGMAIAVSGSVLTTSGSVLVIGGASGISYGNLIVVPSAIVLRILSRSSVYKWSSAAVGWHYVKLSYAENLTTYASGVLDSAGHTRVENSYFVTVDQTVPTLNEICLSVVGVGGGPTILWAMDTRSYVTPLVPSWGVSLDPTLNTIPEVNTAYDHVMARGTGIVTSKNPHGLGPSDIEALPTGSLRKYGNITSGVMTYNKVYQNDSSIIYFDANVETDLGRRVDLLQYPLMDTYNYSWSLYASSSGVLTSTGSLFGSIIELARLSYRYSLTTPGFDAIAFQDDLQGLIPANWYYKVSATGTPQYNVPTGSIRFTTTYL